MARAVTLFTGQISFLDIIICIISAYLLGVLACVVSYPYGLQIAPLAVPAGLAIWALRTGDMTSLLQRNYTLAQREVLYGMLKWEGFVWLAIVAAGYAGVLSAHKLHKFKPSWLEEKKKDNSQLNRVLQVVTALIAAIVIAQFAVGILAKDVKIFDKPLGSVAGQPEVGQIAFAVFVAFGIAGFVIKKFVDADYIFGTIATALLSLASITIFARRQALEHMVASWPVAFFSHAICAILPIQMVAFGAIGSIVGFWLAIKHTCWRKHAHHRE